MNYNSLMNKPTINYRELIGDSTVSEVGGITEEQFNTLLNTDLSSYYTKAQIDDLFSRSFVYREKSGSIVTFDCPESTTSGITKVVSDIVAVQSGTGDPSPTNIRPITGWSAVNVYISPTTLSSDGTTYTTTLKDGQGNPMTCYGGTLTNENGVQRLVNTHVFVDMSTITWYQNGSLDGNLYTNISDIKVAGDVYSSMLKTVSPSTPSTSMPNASIRVRDDNQTILIQLEGITTQNASIMLSGAQLVYELATPQQIPQDNLAIASSAGINNIWSDSGDITVKALDRIIQG